MKKTTWIISGSIFVLLAISGIITYQLLKPDNSQNGDDPSDEIEYLYSEMIGSKDNFSIKLHYIDHAAIMIETEAMRIYIDPYNLNESFAEKPADIIFITHDHSDHYDQTSIDYIYTTETEIFCPDSCEGVKSSYNAVGLVPGNSGTILDCEYQAFYMYNLEGLNHPQSAKWCSYILTIDNYTIFHGGDSDNIPEYSQIANLIDIAYLPIGGRTYTMDFEAAIDAIGVINPKMMIPIHHWNRDYSQFITDCKLENPATDVITTPILYLKKK